MPFEKGNKVMLGRTLSVETRKRISRSLLGRKFTPEHKEKISQSQKGNKNSFYGKHHNEKAKKKISEVNKINHPRYWLNREFSDEHRRKMSQAHIGQKRSEETKKKMRMAHKGFRGHRHSSMAKKKISENCLRTWARKTPEQIEARNAKLRRTLIKNKTYKKRLSGANIYSRAKGGKRKDLNGQFFRSRTEANYARFLKLCKCKYHYEWKTFVFHGVRKGCVSYTPDFYLPKENKYVEVKGWLDPKSITKLKRFKKYYPGEFEKLIISKQNLRPQDVIVLIEIGFQINQIEDFTSIAKKARKLIPKWE